MPPYRGKVGSLPPGIGADSGLGKARQPCALSAVAAQPHSLSFALLPPASGRRATTSSCSHPAVSMDTQLLQQPVAFLAPYYRSCEGRPKSRRGSGKENGQGSLRRAKPPPRVAEGSPIGHLAPDSQVQAAGVTITAAGNLSVAIGGKGSGSTVITAARNKVESHMTQTAVLDPDKRSGSAGWRRRRTGLRCG